MIRKQIEAGLRRLPIELWLDDDDVVRRLEASLVPPGGDGSSRLTLTFEFAAYGIAVAVEDPPTAEVVSAGKGDCPETAFQ